MFKMFKFLKKIFFKEKRTTVSNSLYSDNGILLDFFIKALGEKWDISIHQYGITRNLNIVFLNKRDAAKYIEIITQEQIDDNMINKRCREIIREIINKNGE